jgi:hypothetical protein
MPLNAKKNRDTKRTQAGSMLLEVAIASAVVLIVATGVMTLTVTALTTTENQGHLMARTAEYSQDKMEQLMALAYCDASSDTTQVPTVATGGVGLAGCPIPLDTPATGTGIGGSSNFASPVTGYVDYLDISGNVLTSSGTQPAGSFYMRVWQISAGPGGVTAMKQITVTTKVLNEVGSNGVNPQTTVVSLKCYPF